METTDEIAKALAFLASDEGYITGIACRLVNVSISVGVIRTW
jgi:hypothetical protein